jgi:hypothetical protein
LILWPNILDFVPQHPWFYGQTFLILWPNILDFMAQHYWFYGQTFLILCPNILDFMAKHSWFYDPTCLILWPNSIDFMAEHDWFYGLTLLILWPNIIDLMVKYPSQGVLGYKIKNVKVGAACRTYPGRAHRKDGGPPGCSPPKPPKLKFSKHRFCRYYDIKVLRDFPFNRNQPLKSADD